MIDERPNEKFMIIRLIARLIKKILLNKMSSFPEPFSHNENKINVKLDLFNCATKFDLKGATCIVTSSLLKKLFRLKLKIRY